MKKVILGLTLGATLFIAGCSTDNSTKESDSTTSSTTQQTKTSSTSSAENLTNIVDKFQKDGLAVINPRKMTKDDFGMAPMNAKEGTIFEVQQDSEGNSQNARILYFDNLDDLKKMKSYYDDLGKDSAMMFSYTAANEKKKVLMQFNGDLPQDLVQKYVDSANLTLTPVNFSQTSTSADSETSSQSATTEQSQNSTVEQQPQVNTETYEQIKQRTLNSTPADRTNWSNKEWEAFGMALHENSLAMDDAGNIISQAEKDQQIAAETQQATPQESTSQQDLDSLSLTDFVNKYGMSPVAYKVQNGMSQEEALRSTKQKTSGEVQLGIMEYGIQP